MGNEDLNQIATATTTTTGSKKGQNITHRACLEMTFRRSAKSWNVKTCLVA